jgi:hypothetical protein
VSITYTIDETRGRVTLHYAGIITDGDLFVAYDRLYEDPRHRIGMDELADCRAVERIEVTRSGLQALSASTALRLDANQVPWRVAIVAPSDAVFGMARMYEAFRSESPEQVQVFRDLPAAELWLEQKR